MQSLVSKAEVGQSLDELTFDQNFIDAYSAQVTSEGLGDGGSGINNRLYGFQQVLNSGNYNLTTPFTFTAYGDSFTITGDIGVNEATETDSSSNVDTFTDNNFSNNDNNYIVNNSGNKQDYNSNGTIIEGLNSSNYTVTTYLHHKHSHRNHSHSNDIEVTNNTSNNETTNNISSDYQAGYNAGYQAGYQAGKNDILKEIINLISSLFSTTNSNSTVQQPVYNSAHNCYATSDDFKSTNSQNIADTHQDEIINNPDNSNSTVIDNVTYYHSDSNGNIWSWRYDK